MQGNVVLPQDGSYVVVEEDTIVCPTSGYVLAIAEMTVDKYHVYGSSDMTIHYGVSTQPSIITPNEAIRASVHATDAATGKYTPTLPCHYVFPVAAGSHAFYLIAAGWDAPHDLRVAYSTMTLVFIPSSYEL